MTKLPDYRFEQRSDGWWLIGTNGDECGPYERRQDADDDRRGLLRFYRTNPKYIGDLPCSTTTN